MNNEKIKSLALDLINKRCSDRPEGWIFTDVKKFGFGQQRKNRKSRRGYQTDKEMRKRERVKMRKKSHYELFKIVDGNFINELTMDRTIQTPLKFYKYVFYIIYTDKSRETLDVLKFDTCGDDDIDLYVRASREVFFDYSEAIRYCRVLASKHNKQVKFYNEGDFYLD